MSHTRIPDPPQPIRTFDEVFQEMTITADERAALVWHLAMFRARRTVEILLPETDVRFVLGYDPRDVLR
jgi:hypothetical protein